MPFQTDEHAAREVFNKMSQSAGWYRLAAIHSQPVLASGRGSHAHLFALNEQAGVLYFRFALNSQYTIPTASGLPATPLGGQLTSSPAACARDGKVHVFGRGLDHAFWVNSSPDNGANWTGWRSLGGIWTSGPSVVRGAEILVVGKGQDGAVWALRSPDGQSFTLAPYVPGAIPGEPTAALGFNERPVVLASFPAGLRGCFVAGQEWAPAPLVLTGGERSPVLASDPVATSDFRVELIAGRDPIGRLWLYSYDSQRGTHANSVVVNSQILGKPALGLGVYLTSDPYAIVVVRAHDGRLAFAMVPPGDPVDGLVLRSLDQAATSDPVVACCEGVRTSLVFARDGDQLMYRIVAHD